jgi:hypothetical protein
MVDLAVPYALRESFSVALLTGGSSVLVAILFLLLVPNRAFVASGWAPPGAHDFMGHHHAQQGRDWHHHRASVGGCRGAEDWIRCLPVDDVMRRVQCGGDPMVPHISAIAYLWSIKVRAAPQHAFKNQMEPTPSPANLGGKRNWEPMVPVRLGASHIIKIQRKSSKFIFCALATRFCSLTDGPRDSQYNRQA